MSGGYKVRFVLIFVLMLGWVPAAWAQTPETPGRIGIWAAPGMLGDTGPATAPGDFTVTGDFKMPGTGRNDLNGWFTIGNWSNFVPPPGRYNWQGDATIRVIRGSTAQPDTGSDIALVVQKIGTNYNNERIMPAGWFGIVGSQPAPGAYSHGTALIGDAEDNIAHTYQGHFFEGVRGDCYLRTGSALSQCNGVNGHVGVDPGVQYGALFGMESAIENRSGIAPNFNFNGMHFDASFLATCGAHYDPGTPAYSADLVNCENGFMVNPNSVRQYLRGFLIPPNGGAGGGMAPNGFGVQINAHIAQGVKLDSGAFTSAAITLPNGPTNGISALTFAGNLNSVLRMDGDDHLILGAGADTTAVVLGHGGALVQSAADFNVQGGSYQANGVYVMQLDGINHLGIGSDTSIPATVLGHAGGLVQSASDFNVQGGSYRINGTYGANCSAPPTAGFTVTGGIVTAC